MRGIIKKTISVTAGTLFILSSNVFADVKTDMLLKTDEKSGMLKQYITISDSVLGAEGKMVALKIWHQGKNTESFVPGVNDKECIASVGQTIADSAGEFSLTIPFNKAYGEDGKYQGEIKIEDIDEIIPFTFYIADVSTVNNFLEDINDNTSLSQMTEADFSEVLKKGKDYGIDTGLYSKLSETDGVLSAEQKNVILKIRASLESRNSSGKQTSMEDFKSIFIEAVILEAFASSGDGAFLEEVIEKHNDYLGLKNLENAKGIYKTYEALNSKSEALKKIGSTETKGEFIEKFKESVFVRAIEEVAYWTELEAPIEENADYLKLGEDYTKFKSSTQTKEKMLKYIIRNKTDVKSLASFKTLFGEAADESSNQNNGNTVGTGGTGGGGGGGAGGGSGGGSKKPSVEVVVGEQYTEQKVFAPAPAKPEITDISGHWGKSAIDYLVNAGVVSGRPDGSFAPDENITREEFTKLIVLAFNFYKEGDSAEFNDVEKDRWSYPYIASAVNFGIVNGVDGESFKPDENISREDMAVILYRAYQRTVESHFRGELEVKFKDFDEVSDYAKNSVSMLSNLGLINGDGESFNPHLNATRAEASQILYNVLKGEGL